MNSRSDILSVAFSPSGKWLASGYSDGTITIYDMDKLNNKSYKPETLGKDQGGHASRINSIAFSPNGKQLASGSSDNSIKIWDIDKLGKKDYKPKTLGKVIMGVKDRLYKGKPIPIGIASIAFSPNGKQLASADFSNSNIKIWYIDKLNNTDYKPKILLKPFNEACTVAFSPNGKRLAIGVSDYDIKIMDISKSKQIYSLNTTTDERGCKVKSIFDFFLLQSIAFSPNGKLLASNGYPNELKIWNMDELDKSNGKKDTPIDLSRSKHGFSSALFSPDGNLLASLTNDGTIQIWNTNKFTNKKHIPKTLKTKAALSIAWGKKRKVITEFKKKLFAPKLSDVKVITE